MRGRVIGNSNFILRIPEDSHALTPERLGVTPPQPARHYRDAYTSTAPPTHPPAPTRKHANTQTNMKT